MHVPTLNFDLGEEIDMLRESVAQFAAAHIAPLAAEADASNHFPNQLWRQLGEQGLLGMTVEEEYGGSGMGYLAHVVAMEEISRASGGIGLGCQRRDVGGGKLRHAFAQHVDFFAQIKIQGGDVHGWLRYGLAIRGAPGWEDGQAVGTGVCAQPSGSRPKSEYKFKN